MSLRNEIKAYLDGELDGDTALRVAQMLQSDEALRKEADDYRALSSTLRLVAEPDVATQGLENTLRALRMEKEPAKARAWWTGGWGYAMAGAAAILMVFLFFPHPKPDMFATDETKADSVAATASGHAEFAAPTAGNGDANSTHGTAYGHGQTYREYARKEDYSYGRKACAASETFSRD